jgi:hypothetical protein
MYVIGEVAKSSMPGDHRASTQRRFRQGGSREIHVLCIDETANNAFAALVSKDCCCGDIFSHPKG